MRLSSKTLSKHFTHITASISSDTFKHIIGMSEKRSTPDSETVPARKLILPPLLPPVPPLDLFKSFGGLVFLGSIFTLF